MVVTRWLVAALSLITTICSGSAQVPNEKLHIDSPADGTAVDPGQTLRVTVSAQSGTAVSQVAVFADEIAISDWATSVPATFSLVVPTTIGPGNYLVSAFGNTNAGDFIVSDVVAIHVERSDMPSAIVADPNRFAFPQPGISLPVRITGTFGANQFDVTRSTHLTYSTLDPTVATVDSPGVIKARGQGSTTVRATYTLGASSVSVNVPVTVPAPSVTSNPSSLDFGAVAVGSTSAPQTLTITNRTNNGMMTIKAVNVMGNFSQTNNCSTNFPPNCTFTVTFSPTAVGPRSGKLQISNSMDDDPLEISLTGTGQ